MGWNENLKALDSVNQTCKFKCCLITWCSNPFGSRHYQQVSDYNSSIYSLKLAAEENSSLNRVLTAVLAGPGLVSKALGPVCLVSVQGLVMPSHVLCYCLQLPIQLLTEAIALSLQQTQPDPSNIEPMSSPMNQGLTNIATTIVSTAF